MAKAIIFLEDSLKQIKSFPDAVIDIIGHELNEIQEGRTPGNWKPINTVGLGVREMRISLDGNAYRTLYIAKFDESIYVLHAFQKKSRKTPVKEIEIARRRLQKLTRDRK